MSKPGIYPPGDLGWDVLLNADLDSLDTIINKFWSETVSRLRLINQPLTYDLLSNAAGSACYLDIGSVTPPDNKEIHVARIVGTLTGAPVDPNSKYLNGLVWALTNSATTGGSVNDVTRVRGLIGTVTADGPGSVRGIHSNAVSTANATSATIINGGAFSCSPTSVITPGNSKCLDIAELSGLSGITDGIRFDAGAGKFRRGLTFFSDNCTECAMFLVSGTPTGRIKWNLGDYIWSPAVGYFEFRGADSVSHYFRVLAGEANTQDKGIILASHRGVAASPTTLVSADTISNLYFTGYDGNTQINAGYITAFVDGAVATGNVPGRIEIVTRQSATLASRLKIGAGLQIDAPSGGDPGIGNISIGGSTAQKATGTAWVNPSDARIKEHVERFADGLTLVNQIRPVRFSFNGLGNTPKGKSGIGVIAQEIKEIAPYTVTTYNAKLHPEDESPTQLYRFDASALTFVLINAVQELSQRLEKVEARQ